MATRESRAYRRALVEVPSRWTGLRVSLFQPGDASTGPAKESAKITGNPREMGRELRSMLEDLAEGSAA